MADRVGQQLGNYRLLRLLGRGGYAEVYLGEHLYLKTLAAIKVFQPFLTEQDRDAFLREAQTMARLIHPHIIRILEGSVEEGIPFLVMDYAPNGTIRDRHPESERLALETILAYVKQVAGALQYAHDEQLIHRDIKPGNLLLGRHKEVLVSDFGLAVATRRSFTQTQQEVAGTVAYMAPEQIEGRARPASDQYSLGIVVYEWLSGACPFQGSVREVISQHLLTPPPPLRAKVPSLSTAVEQVVLRALAKALDERFPTISDFANALDEASQQEQRRLIKRPSPRVQQPKVTPNLLPPLDPSPSEISSTLSSRPGPPSQREVSPPATPPTLPPIQEPIDPATQQSSVNPPPLGTTLVTYHGHISVVTAIAWSPDGSRLVSGSWDRTVHVWESTTSKRLLQYQEHAEGVTAVAWSPNSKYLASGSHDGIIQVWDAVIGKTLFTYHGHAQAITALAWSPGGKHLASASADLTIHIWQPTAQGHLFTYSGHRSLVETIMWAADRKRITTVGRDQTAQSWDIATGGNVYTSHPTNAPARALAWSPDGKYILAGSESGEVILKEVASSRFLFTYRGHTEKVIVVGWSPDGARAASGGADTTVQIWQAR